MTRIIENNNYVAVEVLTSAEGKPIPGAVVTPSQPVYSDREMTTQVATVTAGADGAARFYAKPGTYTFTTNATNAAAIEAVEVLSAAVGTGGGGGHVLHSGGASPTAAAGAGAGTSPPAPVVTAGSNDERGNITFGTGTTPAAGAQVTVTFASAFSAAPIVILEPANSATAALNDYVTSTTTGFTFGAQVAPAASQGNTVFSFNYYVIG